MAETAKIHEPGTADPRPPEEIEAAANKVFETILAGGVAIIPLDVTYGIVALRESGIRRIFAAKNRSYEKPSGFFGSWQVSRELHRMDRDRHEMVRNIIETDNLPFSIVAPFRADHPILADVDPFVIANSSKAGTLDMVMNAGQLHDEIARQVLEREVPVFGSSANTSLAGSKYRYGDIEPEVRNAADFHLDHGLSKYANDRSRSSTIIDFSDFHVIRIGVCFDQLKVIFRERFDVNLRVDERTAG